MRSDRTLSNFDCKTGFDSKIDTANGLRYPMSVYYRSVNSMILAKPAGVSVNVVP